MAQEGVRPERGAVISRTFAIAIAVVLLAVGIGVGWVVGFFTAPGPTQPTIQKIFDEGIMVVGTDAAFPPFEDVNATTGVIEGFDIDLIKEIGLLMGVDVDVRNIGWDAVFVAVPDRTVDLAISAMTITEERKETFLFSDPYFYSNLTLVIRPGGPMDGVINSHDDLAGKRVAFQEFTTSDAWVEEHLIGEEGIQPSEVKKTRLFTDAILLLLADETDAVIIDSPVAESYQAAGQVKIVEVIRTEEAFGIPMPLGELALKSMIDGALRHLHETGRYEEIFEKWFGPA